MGNEHSSPSGDDSQYGGGTAGSNTTKAPSRGKGGTASFLLENAAQTLAGAAVCGSLNDTLDENGERRDDVPSKLLGSVRGAASGMCVSPSTTSGVSPTNDMDGPGPSHSRRRSRGRRGFDKVNSDEENNEPNPTSALFARALVSEVTDNPKTMRPADMAEREKKLIRAQERAKRGGDGARPVGTPGGVNVGGGTAGAVLGALQNFSLTGRGASGGGDADPANASSSRSAVLPPNPLTENRAQVQGPNADPGAEFRGGKHTVTIGLSLSRRHSTLGHPDTVTRQTAFDFNELQDRQYKYVSSTDSSGWLAGGGERGGRNQNSASPGPGGVSMSASGLSEDGEASEFNDVRTPGGGAASANGGAGNDAGPGSASGGVGAQGQHHKVAAPDTVHLPIIHIDCDSPQQVDKIIAALARGEVFIPHMSVLPESLSVNGISPPDLVVRFGCERNDDVPPDEWPNWCLEFMHNQLYEYFAHTGARWTRRPFQITLARKVRWRTVKHMNRFFAHSERVINGWRERGPQYLDPQLSYIEGGATPEEVARPHGIYLLRNGRPTNYFAPNFEPPYTTKMTRSLLLNVIGKSWDKKRRDWSSEPIPRLVTPAVLLSTVCGCTGGDPSQGGFLASEATRQISPIAANHSIAGRSGGVPQTQGVSAEYRSRQEKQSREEERRRAQEQQRAEIEAQRESQRRREEQQRAEIEASQQQWRKHRSLEKQRSLERSERSPDSRGSDDGQHRRNNSHDSGGSIGSAGAPQDRPAANGRGRSRSTSRDSSKRGSRRGRRREDQQEDHHDEPPQEEAEEARQPTRRERLKNRLHGRRHQHQPHDGPPPAIADEDATPLIKNGSKEFMISSAQSREDDDEKEGGINLQPLPEEQQQQEEEEQLQEQEQEGPRDYHSRRPEPLQLDEPAPMTSPIEPVSPRGNSSEPEGTPEASTPERHKKLGSGGKGPEEAHLHDEPAISDDVGATTGSGSAPAAASDPFSFDAFGSSDTQHTGYSEDEAEAQAEGAEEEDSVERTRRGTPADSAERDRRRDLGGGVLRTPPRLRPRFSNGYRGGDREDFGAVSSPSDDGSDRSEPTTPLNYAGEESSPSRGKDGSTGAAPPAEHLSVGESHTTVPVMNSTPGKFIERERQRRKEREREREKERKKMELLERALEEQDKIKSSKKDTGKKDRKKGMGKRRGSKSKDQDDMEEKMALIAQATAEAAAETEKARAAVEAMQRQQKEQEELEQQQRNLREEMDREQQERLWGGKSIRRQQQPYASPSSSKAPPVSPSSSRGSRSQSARRSKSSRSSPRSSKSGSGGEQQQQPNEIEESVSNDNSMEYSLESGMVGPGGGVASLLGADKSVVSTATDADQSLLSYVTRSTMMGGAGPSVRKGGSSRAQSSSPKSSSASVTGGGQKQLQEKVIEEGDEAAPADDDGDDISLSLLESESDLEEAVPTDEELFAVGWAKALDPSSGSYYYYTLDRTQTVWDNPIGTIVPFEGESPPGAVPASSASSSGAFGK